MSSSASPGPREDPTGLRLRRPVGSFSALVSDDSRFRSWTTFLRTTTASTHKRSRSLVLRSFVAAERLESRATSHAPRLRSSRDGSRHRGRHYPSRPVLQGPSTSTGTLLSPVRGYRRGSRTSVLAQGAARTQAQYLHGPLREGLHLWIDAHADVMGRAPADARVARSRRGARETFEIALPLFGRFTSQRLAPAPRDRRPAVRSRKRARLSASEAGARPDLRVDRGRRSADPSNTRIRRIALQSCALRRSRRAGCASFSALRARRTKNPSG